MPPLYDPMEIENALRNEAIPALQRFADRPGVRNGQLSRFDHDDPPPYQSSTEDTEDEAAFLPPATFDWPPDLQERLEAPLNEEEIRQVASNVAQHYNPRPRFDDEEEAERERVFSWARHHPDADVRRLLGPRGWGEKIFRADRRCSIVARHLIKRRWQKLGVWNPDWGIPEPMVYDYTKLPSRNYRIERWAWQRQSACDDFAELNSPVRRAVQLRQNQKYGEHAPMPPRPHLPSLSSPSWSNEQAESYITSRPWFQIALDAAEKTTRLNRIDYRARRNLKKLPYLKDTWKERGDWQDKWDNHGRSGIVGWTWRHESPSPEPEDLSGIENMDDLELTPSEADALENIPVLPPTPPRPPPSDAPSTHWLFGDPASKGQPPAEPESGVEAVDEASVAVAGEADEHELPSQLPPPYSSPPHSRLPPQQRSRTARPPRRGSSAAAPLALPDPLAPQVQRQRVAKPLKPSRLSDAQQPREVPRRSKRIAEAATAAAAAAAASNPAKPPVLRRSQQAKPAKQPAKQAAKSKQPARQARAGMQQIHRVKPQTKSSTGVTKSKAPPRRSRRS